MNQPNLINLIGHSIVQLFERLRVKQHLSLSGHLRHQWPPEGHIDLPAAGAQISVSLVKYQASHSISFCLLAVVNRVKWSNTNLQFLFKERRRFIVQKSEMPRSAIKGRVANVANLAKGLVGE